jgi:hypothetical protein
VTDEYIAQYCREGTRKSSGKIPIKDIIDHPLCMILFTITKLAGSTGPHLASKSQMVYAIECLEPRVFNWCGGLLVNLKDQITKCKTGRQKQFGYGSLLVSFFLEWVPLMHPWIEMPRAPLTEPQMERWTSLMSQLGGGPQIFHLMLDSSHGGKIRSP